MRVTNYETIAHAYDRRYKVEDYQGIENALVEFVANGPDRVLEIGCGTGHWLRKAQPHARQVFGVDLSWSMLSQARRSGHSGNLSRGAAEHAPLADECVDRLFCINAHHHFADKQLFLKESRRLLRAGGRVMLIGLDPHTGADRWFIYDYFAPALALDKERYPSCGQLRGWMRQIGFTEVETRKVQHSPEDVFAHEALERDMLARDQVSSLAMLTDDEYDAGLGRIRSALEADANLRLFADLRVYATYGTVR
jgi:ubiquinone/menaquinone biosynthesis C-methylase UbiE